MPSLVVVNMDMVETAPPPEEQPDGEQHDDNPDECLGGLLYRLRKVTTEKHQRQAQDHERRAVAKAPHETHETGFACLLALLFGGDEGRDRSQVVGIACVT